MKLTELTVEYAKEYLGVDHDQDDNRILGHVAAAKHWIAAAHGYSLEQMEELELNDYLLDLAMIYIQDLYDNGTITSTAPLNFLTMDRRF